MDNLYIFLIILLLLAAFLLYKAQDIKRKYKAEVLKGLTRLEKWDTSIITHDDIKHLPKIVQKYLAYVDVIGKEKVHNVRIITDLEMKMDPQKDWSRTRVEQYSIFDDQPARLYLMKINFNGIPLLGLDSYVNCKGNMLMKLGGLFTIVDDWSTEMDKSAAALLLSDMCIGAPATLIDKRLEWEVIDPLTVRVIFKDNTCNVSAVLSFNAVGQLIDFSTEDKYYSPKGKTYQKVRWSTPVKNYKDFNGLKLATYGEAIWHFEASDFCYGRVNTVEIQYNCKDFR